MRKITLLIAGLLLAGLLFLVARLAAPPQTPLQAGVVSAASIDTRGFTLAEPPADIRFPRDHGPHPSFQTEWWYYTGNLETQDGQHFGYQLTFFRRALTHRPAERASNWAADQAFMAHFTISDVSTGTFQASERLARGAAGLAGAQAGPFRVWLENWSVEELEPGVYSLAEENEGMSLDLTLREEKAPVLQGEQGYSRKGAGDGQASFYYSLTRLASSGQVTVNGRSHTVQGLSWMDHEYSTSALSQDQVGWDWFALQLADGRELMVFQIRRTDGSVDPFSSGVWVPREGEPRILSAQDFTIRVHDTWKSPHSGAEYPSRWTVAVPSQQLELHIRPYLPDQELNVSYSYWEGAVQIDGQVESQAVSGSGYVELTGYSGSMGGEF